MDTRPPLGIVCAAVAAVRREGGPVKPPDSLDWRKSSHSNSVGCLEYASDGASVYIRDSKDRGGPVLSFSPLEWQRFLNGVRRGEFELPTHRPGDDTA
jgi:Domain of unknown function (DUF397)